MIRNNLKSLGKELLRGVGARVRRAQVSPPAGSSRTEANGPGAQLSTRSAAELAASEDEPPVVARLIVEIRSDGSRTVARGAMIDEQSGERVSLVAQGHSPLSLAAQLAKNLLSLPLTHARFVRSLKSDKPPPEDPR